MADSANMQIRVVTTPLVSRLGQVTTGLPTNNTESAMDTSLYYESSDNDSSSNDTLPTSSSTDARPYKTSITRSFNIGFIGQNVPELFAIEGGGGGPGVTTYYKMRGYYATGAVYETWVVTEEPSVTPPSGHVLTNVVIVSTWQVSA